MVWSVGAGVTWVDVQVGDFNGDGLDDLIGRWSQSGQWWGARSNGSSFSNVYLGNWSVGTGVTWADVQVGDFTGDGRADIVGRWQETGNWYVGKSNGAGFTNAYWGIWSTGTGVTWVDVKVGDFNGDGKADIVGRWKEAGQWWVGQSAGSGMINRLLARWTANLNWVDIRIGDFDGDGIDDVIGRWKETGNWYVAGSAPSQSPNQAWGNWSAAIKWVHVVVGDFDGDRKTDVAGRDQQTGNWYVGRSTGTSLTSSVWATWSTTTVWSDVRAAAFI